ncbi:colicin V processing peptidase [Luteibacter rhizovicinus]|uniref:Colicin V processing peptidase n=1 Tax=Luteibacter rhizovicinus TaxID=242606 RepID=A0A4R3YH79_9GAMM|nr:peptidase domain-containing ABC transporter [Luteibacter rhizovicinus]TCV91647.1 colicin V processing peptidase [Luteibacter rhizovicinus]
MRFSGTRSVPLVMQAEAAECGLACVAMLAAWHGHRIDLATLRRRFPTSLKGAALPALIDMLSTLALRARPLRAEMAHLRDASLPCMLHWDLNHFVVLTARGRRGMHIHDPARGAGWMTIEDVGTHFTGILLEVTPAPDFRIADEQPRLSLRSVTGRLRSLAGSVTQVLGLALAIEALALVLPYFTQIVIDRALVTGDRRFLLAITAGFLIVLLAQSALTVARGWLLSWLGATLNAQWSVNLFSHLLRLPLDYFGRRHTADILSRFTSLRMMQSTLTGAFIEALLDGLVGVTALAVLCFYSLPMTGLVIAVLSGYGLLRWLFSRKLWHASEEQLVYAARQQTELMESIRGAQTIRLANQANRRRVRFENVTHDAGERDMRIQRLNLAFGALAQGLFGAQRLALFAFGAWFVMNGRLSAGMLVAFAGYADQLVTKTGSLIDKLVELRLLGVHLRRVADIALTEPEAHTGGRRGTVLPSTDITVRDLGYRYGMHEPWVFRHLNFTVAAGESVAIAGPSGCGKSTLARLLLGLVEPTEGAVLIGGVDIRDYGLDNYRRLLGAVLQDDELFAGSIADNISFFDEGGDATMQHIESAARAAAIHDDIVGMPMGYESLAGDMGSSLSGGQKQRVVIARALYRQPSILLLDEATSHLDVTTEQRVNAHIRSAAMTRIVIAHRPETLRSADRVIDLCTGENTELPAQGGADTCPSMNSGHDDERGARESVRLANPINGVCT